LLSATIYPRFGGGLGCQSQALDSPTASRFFFLLNYFPFAAQFFLAPFPPKNRAFALVLLLLFLSPHVSKA